MAAINREHAVFISGNELYVTLLTSSLGCPGSLPCPGGIEGRYTALALSQEKPNLLALACSSQTYIVDLKKRCRISTLPGIGRAVTAVAFAGDKASTVAIGHIDGSISVCPTGTLESSPLRLQSSFSSCSSLAFNPARSNILASSSFDTCEVWELEHSLTRPIGTLRTSGSRITSLVWSSSNAEILVTSCADGMIRVFELSDILQLKPPPNGSSSIGSINDGLLSLIEAPYDRSTQPTAEFNVGAGLDTISWVQDSVLLGLTQAGRECFLLGFGNGGLALSRTWSCSFSNSTKTAGLQTVNGRTTILGASENGVEEHVVPTAVCDELELNDKSRDPGIPSDDLVEAATKSGRHAQQVSAELGPTTYPVSISQLRNESSSFSKMSRQLQQVRVRKSSRIWASLKEELPLNEVEMQNIEPAPPASITSSLELPDSRNRDEDVISPMPFLSPGIPAREKSPFELGLFVDDSGVTSVQLPKSSLETTIPSPLAMASPANDSEDSDDEAYAGDLQGSTTFLPGGINVPLPKACGALFHPNGQLLTFFPPKTRQATPPAGEVAQAFRDKRSKGERIVKLFPSFGNLEKPSSPSDDGLSIDSEDLVDEDIDTASLLQEPSTRPTSTVVQPLDNLETLKIPSAYENELLESKVVVRVYEINDFQLLSPVMNVVAQEYRILCKDHESGAQLCIHNSEIAQGSGLEEVAQAWWILSKLLEDRVPLTQAISPGSPNAGVWRVAQQLQILALDELGAALLMADECSFASFGKLRWASHPIGGTWLIRKILEWAEQRADVQFLGCAAAILSQADPRASSVSTTAEQLMIRHLPTYSLDYFAYASEASRAIGKPATPVLRTHAASITTANDSPTKHNPDAAFMSRSSSQMATPALEPNGTPPWSVSLTRHSTTLSTTSGSASPEASRGSYGTPAQRTLSYAQSISERAAMFYNWSPTPGRSDGTPSVNGGLSSSLPNGSWAGKSVSFASTTYTDDTRGNSWSSVPRLLTQDDDNDSDKTVEDSSVPHTPKSPVGGPAYALSNTDMFADEVSGCAKARLMPLDLEHTGRVWCLYYGELLRSWNMNVKAAELEKAIGLTVGLGPEYASTELVVQPVFRNGHRRTCCIICDTIAAGIVQTCPACLHVSHLSCVEALFAELRDEAYSCPSGCGCDCPELPYVEQEIQPQQDSPSQPGLRRKPSFTDPRRWRARVEGDSW